MWVVVIMEIIEKDDNNNQIIGYEPQLINSKINFNGKNNRLICEDNVKLHNSVIDFKEDNAIVYLSSNRNVYRLSVSINNDSVCYLDENTYMNGKLYLILSEQKHIFIGRQSLMSFGIWMRLADPHLIYDCTTKERINLTKSIYVGDHVWIGQDSLILKGTKIGSGSIIGAKAVVSNKKIPSNTSWAGNPVKQVSNKVFFDDASVHAYTSIDTQKSLTFDSEQWIYKNEGEILDFDEIDKFLTDTKDVDEKVDYLYKIRNNASHNRFYIE